MLFGDVLAMTAFVVAGLVQHGSRPFANPTTVVVTVAPFVVAWLAVAPVGGLYTTDAVRSIRRTLVRTVPVWIGTVGLGQAIRVVAFGESTALTFVAVTLVVGGLLVVGWRVLATVLFRREKVAE